MPNKNSAAEPIVTDILVAGSGIAGLSFALKAADYAHVLVVTKKELVEANTNYAQGGLAAALDAADSAERHVQDTIKCGDGLCEEPVARQIVAEAPRFVRELEAWGARFTHGAAGALDLGLEGGHSARRIVHAKDFTGREIERALVSAVRKNPRIKIMENTLILDLLLKANPAQTPPAQNRALGAVVLNQGVLLPVRAKRVVLATGGAGKIYLYTTNPDIATGDGMAIAWRAGVSLKNLEFVQFHPTCLYHPKLRNFLISEAVRGEGAILKNRRGKAFMKSYDARGELAPRDVVARSIDAELKKTGNEFVYLDISHKSESFLKNRFPNIFERLLSVGIDMAKDPVPVVPAAHYFCGGVKADVAGGTELPGLYAIGEVACTGLHGANRLASNSLLEACAMAHYAAEALRKETPQTNGKAAVGVLSVTRWGEKTLADSDVNTLIAHNWDETRRLMANYVGIVRSRDRLTRAARRLALIQVEVEELVRTYAPNQDLAELWNILALAQAVVASGLLRKESRGLHYMLDYPDKNPKFAKPMEVSWAHQGKIIAR
ncbi:MAG: L-aspartate oxidase [Elusimicrobia bacterium]|nr:L-aspartate oxidase [Elusimicrobiota bacterium]